MINTDRITSLDTLLARIDTIPDENCDIFLGMIDELTEPDSSDLPDDIIEMIRTLDTDSLSLLRLEYSICPMHCIDYCACFEDDDPECAAIRTMFPKHNT